MQYSNNKNLTQLNEYELTNILSSIGSFNISIEGTDISASVYPISGFPSVEVHFNQTIEGKDKITIGLLGGLIEENAFLFHIYNKVKCKILDRIEKEYRIYLDYRRNERNSIAKINMSRESLLKTLL